MCCACRRYRGTCASVTLAEEVQFARSVYFLMKMRYEENLAFRIDIDASCPKLLLPSMSVRLLINAIKAQQEISNRNPRRSRFAPVKTLVVCNPHAEPNARTVAGPGIRAEQWPKRYAACCGERNYASNEHETAGSVPSGFHYTIPIP